MLYDKNSLPCRIFLYAACFWNCVSSMTASCFKSTGDSSYWIFSGQEGLWSCPSPSPSSALLCMPAYCYHTSRKTFLSHKRLTFSFLPCFPCFQLELLVLISTFLGLKFSSHLPLLMKLYLRRGLVASILTEPQIKSTFSTSVDSK